MGNNHGIVIEKISKAIGEEPYYQAGISDRYLLDTFRMPESVSALEGLLIEAIGNRLELEIIFKGKVIDFGPELKKRDLEEVLSNVKNKVDAFLDTDNCPSPSISYYNIFGKEMRPAWALLAASCVTLPFSSFMGIPLVLASAAALVYRRKITAMFEDKKNNLMALADYSSKYNLIRLNKKIKRRIQIIPNISHEYAHHIQSYFLIENKFTQSFMEGHAIGIQRNISKIYAEKEDNKNFLVQTLERDLYYVLKTYLWSCQENSKEPNPSICRLFENSYHKEIFKISPIIIDTYSLGSAYFLFQELVYGPEIYKKVLFDALKIKPLSSQV